MQNPRIVCEKNMIDYKVKLAGVVAEVHGMFATTKEFCRA